MLDVMAKGKNKKWLFWLIPLTILALTIIYFSIFLSKAPTRLADWLENNGIEYQELSVSPNGHFIITAPKIDLGNNFLVSAQSISGDMPSFRTLSIEKLEITDIVFFALKTKYFIPRLTAYNFSSDFTPEEGKSASFLQMLQHSEISRISIPQATLNMQQNLLPIPLLMDAGVLEALVRYNDIEINDIKNGTVRSFTTSSFDMDSILPKVSAIQSLRLTTGAILVQNISINNFIAILTEPANSNHTFLQISGPQLIKDIHYQLITKCSLYGTCGVDSSPTIITYNIDEVALSSFSTRLSSHSVVQWWLFKLSDRMPSGEDKVQTYITNYAKFFQSIGSFTNIANWISIHTASAIKRKRENLPWPDIDIRDLKFILTAEDMKNITTEITESRKNTTFKKAESSFKKFPDNKTVEPNLSSVPDFLSVEVPLFDKIHISGVEFDISHKDKNGIHVTAGQLDITANFPRTTAPITMRIDLKSLKFPTALISEENPYNFDDPDIFIFNNLNYGKLDISTILDFSWDEKKRTFLLNEYSYNIADMMSIKISGQSSNVDTLLLSKAPFMIAAAAINAKLKNGTLTLNFDPLRTRFEQWAKAHDKAPQETYDKIAMFFDVSELNSNGTSIELATKLHTAIADIVYNGGTLMLHFNAKSPDGLTFADLLKLNVKPTTLLDKIDFSVETKH